MKAIILAAGIGSRLKPLTDHRPKCLVPYQGHPIIDYSIRAIRSCGITEIIAVVGPFAEQIAPAVSRSYRNPDFATTNMVASLFCAEAEFNDDLVVVYGDIIFSPSILWRLLAARDEVALTIDTDWRRLWMQRMENPLEDAESLKLDPGSYVVDIGRRVSSYDEIDGQYMGLILFRKPALSKMKQLYASIEDDQVFDRRTKRQMHMTSFLQYMIQNQIPIKAVPVSGGWLEIDTPDDLLVDVHPEKWS